MSSRTRAILAFLTAMAVQSSLAVEYLSPKDFGRIRGLSVPVSSILAVGYDSTTATLSVFYRDSSGAQQVLTLPADSFTSAGHEKPLPEPVRKGPDQTGRVYFMTHTTLKTFYVYPSGFNTALGVDGSVAAGLALLTGGGALYSSYLFTKEKELGYGRVAMMNYGGELFGIAYPALLGSLLHNATELDWKNRAWDSFQGEYYYDNPRSGKVAAWASMAGFPAGIYLGSRVNFTGNGQYGNASIMTDFSRWAYLYGFMLPLYGSGNSEKTYLSAATGLTMALLPAGFYLGYRITEGEDYSSGRSFMVTSGGVMGTITGTLLPALFRSENRRVYVTSTLLGHAGGTMFGFKFRKENRYTFGQGVFMSFSAAAGAGVALSMPLIARSDNDRFYTIMGLSGGWGGYILGEKLARSIFDTSEKDRQAASNVSFPVIWQWPALLAGPVRTVEIIRINL